MPALCGAPPHASPSPASSTQALLVPVTAPPPPPFTAPPYSAGAPFPPHPFSLPPLLKIMEQLLSISLIHISTKMLITSPINFQ